MAAGEDAIEAARDLTADTEPDPLVKSLAHLLLYGHDLAEGGAKLAIVDGEIHWSPCPLCKSKMN